MISLYTLVAIAFTFFLALAASWAVLVPFFSAEEVSARSLETGDTQMAGLLARKETIFGNIVELEHDYLVNKIDKEVYQSNKELLTKEAAECLAEIDKATA